MPQADTHPPTDLPASPPQPGVRLARIVELLVIFFGLPTAFWLGWLPLQVIAMLWICAVFALVVLWRHHDFDRRQLYQLARGRAFLGPVLRRFAVLAALLVIATALVAPDLLFGFVRQRPRLWTLVMMLYPIFSVLPQGILYRVFFFHRYGSLLPDARARVVASALCFAYSHVVFDNWIAIALTLPGGLLFASTYERSRSALLASIEHALYGCWVITLGLGTFLFYRG